MNTPLVRSRMKGEALGFGPALALVLLLWLVYTVLNILYLDSPAVNAAGFAFGLLGVVALTSTGLRRADCFLRVAPISRQGLVAYGLLTVVTAGAILPFCRWIDLDWMSLLLLAPASAISQELFFRSSLLPGLTKALEGRPRLALALHTVLFGVWHAGVLRLAPLAVGLMVVAIPMLCGTIWGWQSRHDGTIVWAIAQHTLFQMLIRLSEWG